jgi:hypothetical protein
MTSYRKSEVEATGTKGTYVSLPYHGTGMGYQMPDGTVVRSGGNGWYYPVEVESFTADGGKGYMGVVRGILPTYA